MRKRSEYTKLSIIAVARDLFLDNGYTATSIDLIVNKANTTKKTIYGYFSDKMTLFSEVVGSFTNDDFYSTNKIEEMSTLEDLYAALFEAAKSINETLLAPEYAKLVRFVIAEVKYQPDLLVLLEKGATAQSLKYVSEIISIASDRKIINVKNQEMCARRFVGGFLVVLYFDGLLDPSYSRLHKFSQSELVDYVNDFVVTVSTASLDNIAPRVSKYGV